jgi:excinuclease ABC subunit C
MKGFDAKEFVGSLPRRPGVYRMYNADREILYIGKAKNLKDRVGTYFAASNVNPKVQALVGLIAHIEVTVANSETEALLLEYNLIKAHKPRFNVVLRDDKSFPYIQVQETHDFPRLAFYRGSRSVPGRYFGPFPGAGAVKETLRQLQKLFRIAGIAFSPIAAVRVFSIKLVVARLPALGSSPKRPTRRTSTQR